MSTDVISDIASYLVSGEYGKLGTSLFIDELQDQPDNQIVVFSSGGRSIQSTDSHTVLTYFDVHVRNTSKATARSKAIEIRDYLGSKKSAASRQAILLQAPVMEYFGKDSMNRHRYGVFFVAFD
jgi:hypothetical protein